MPQEDIRAEGELLRAGRVVDWNLWRSAIPRRRRPFLFLFLNASFPRE
jgi:hypothetical protein